jgi:hypothetical protein
MSAPVDLVRATLEQAWQAECASDIYLARQVVDLRGLVAADRSRVVELETALRNLVDSFERDEHMTYMTGSTPSALREARAALTARAPQPADQEK